MLLIELIDFRDSPTIVMVNQLAILLPQHLYLVLTQHSFIWYELRFPIFCDEGLERFCGWHLKDQYQIFSKFD